MPIFCGGSITKQGGCHSHPIHPPLTFAKFHYFCLSSSYVAGFNLGFQFWEVGGLKSEWFYLLSLEYIIIHHCILAYTKYHNSKIGITMVSLVSLEAHVSLVLLVSLVSLIALSSLEHKYHWYGCSIGIIGSTGITGS